MMNKKQLLISGGTLVGLLFTVSIYFHLKRRKQDRLTAALLREVKKVLKPATSGLLSEDAFDIHYTQEALNKVNSKIKMLDSKTASAYAKKIHDAWGFWNDDENQVYGVFRALRDKVQVSQVTRAYQKLYSVNLIDKFYDKLSEKEVKKVLSIVNPLPAYSLA